MDLVPVEFVNVAKGKDKFIMGTVGGMMSD